MLSLKRKIKRKKKTSDLKKVFFFSHGARNCDSSFGMGLIPWGLLGNLTLLNGPVSHGNKRKEKTRISRFIPETFTNNLKAFISAYIWVFLWKEDRFEIKCEEWNLENWISKFSRQAYTGHVTMFVSKTPTQHNRPFHGFFNFWHRPVTSLERAPCN